MAKKIQVVSEALKKARQRLDLQRKSLINLPPTEQALVRRAILVKHQRLRQQAVRESRDRSDEYKNFKEEQGAKWELYWKAVRNERKNRREDWMLGPLAPMRDSGIDRQTYGATSPRALYGVKAMEEDKLKHIPFMKGDRVVVISGREKGKIGKIDNIQEATQSARVEGLLEVLRNL